MAITTYAELKSALANFSERADLTTRIPEFISLAHAQINRDLRDHPRMQKRDTAFSIATEYVDTPTDFSELRSMYLNTSPRAELSIQYDNWVSANTSDQPRYVTVTGSTAGGGESFRFGPPPDTTYTATMEYIAKLTAMSADSDHNWVLDNHPGAYLYGSLIHLAAYLSDAARAAGYQQMYGSEIGAILQAAHRARGFGPPMRTQPA
jgi:hypothetical protein